MADEAEAESTSSHPASSSIGSKVAEHIPSSSDIAPLMKISPSLIIVKFIHGMIEIVARGCSIGIILILLISSSTAISISSSAAHSKGYGGGGDPNSTNPGGAAAGWVLFLGIVGIIYEASFLLTRFFHCGFTTIHRKIYLIVDVVVSFV
jgi:hypothetical protein